MDGYIEPEGCELLCQLCASNKARGYVDGGGESDCPQHCGTCGVYLENPLTKDGIAYVLEAIEEYMTMGCGERSVLRQWATCLLEFHDYIDEKPVVEAFLRWTDETDPK
jgi:hypothetical protein